MNYKKILFILLFLPLTINAKEVTVVESNADLKPDIHVEMDWYKETTSNEIVTKSVCDTRGGTFKSVGYKFTANKLTCSISTDAYFSCGDITYGVSDSNARCVASYVKNKSSYCVKSMQDKGKWVLIGDLSTTKNFSFNKRNLDTTDPYVCYGTGNTPSCINNNVVSWNKSAQEYGYCTSIEKESGETVKRVFQALYKTTTGDNAYCIHPGKKFYQEEDTYILSSRQDLTSCKSSKDSNKYCGLAAIVQYAEKNVLNTLSENEYYIAVNTALRLWSAEYLSNTGNDSYWDRLANTTYSTANMYKQTADYILSSGYSGSDSSPKKGVLYGTSPGLNEGFEIFKKAVDGITINGPNITVKPSAVSISSGNTIDLILTTELTNQTDIADITATNGVTINSKDYYDCNGKVCATLNVTIPSELNGGSFSISVKLSSTSSILGTIGFYNSSHGTNAYQSMIIFDKSSPNIVDINVYVNSTQVDESCPVEQSNTVSTDCVKDKNKTGGKLEDAEICSILNASESNKKDFKVESNDYCTVYCREEYTFTFMDKKTALAGRYFRYDVNNDEKYYSTLILSEKQCVSDIDYDKWKEDYQAIYDKVRTTWNEYIKYEAMVSNYYTESVFETAGPCECCRSCNCTSITDEETGEITKSCDTCCSDVSATTATWTRYIHYSVGYSITNIYGNILSLSTTKEEYGSTSSEASTSCGCGGAHVYYTDGSVGENNLKALKVQAYSDYTEAVEALDKLVKKLNNCNLIEGTDFYEKVTEYDPNNILKIEYEETTPNNLNGESYNSYISGSILRDEEISKEISYSYGLESYNSYCNNCEGDLSNLSSYTNEDNELFYWKCGGSYNSNQCTKVYPNYPKNKTVTLNVSINNGYYVGVEFATQVFTGYTLAKTANEVISGKNWIDLPTRIYPVELNQKTKENKEIKVTWELSTNKFSNNSNTYTCYYDVINKLTTYDCDDVKGITDEEICLIEDDEEEGNSNSSNGLILYYRTIDLNNVFPNENKRNIGINWSSLKALDVVEEIEDLGDNIYTKEPMYSVTLTSSDIKKIREYNKDEENNYGYLNNTILCNNLNNNSNLKYVCNSSFLDDSSLGLQVNKNIDSSTINGNEIYYYTNYEEGGN